MRRKFDCILIFQLLYMRLSAFQTMFGAKCCRIRGGGGGGGCSDFPYGIGFAVLFRLNVVSGYNSHCTG
jgi:hypothetical protein